jgi:hypothetical protein
MGIPWEIISGLGWKVYSIIKSKPRVAVEVEFLFEDGGGSSNVGGTVWNLWRDIYLDLCVTNTGAPTTVKRAYISVRDNKHEVLRFSSWKVLKHINYKDLSESPEIDKTLSGAKIGTNDSWGPHVVLFTTQSIVSGEDASLPDGERFLFIEVVGQRLRPLKI